MKDEDKKIENKEEKWFEPNDAESIQAMRIMNCMDTMLFIDQNRGGWIYNKLVGEK